MKRAASLAISFCFFFIAVVFAQVAIKAEVDKTQITTDDTLTYKISVTSFELKTPGLKLPKFEGFKIVSQAQTSKMSFANNKVKTVLVHLVVLSPQRPGKLKIEPAEAKSAQESFASEGFEIKVTPGKKRPQENFPESEEPQFSL